MSSFSTPPTLTHPPLLAPPPPVLAAGRTLLRICHDSEKRELVASDLVHFSKDAITSNCAAGPVHPKLTGLLQLHTLERTLRGTTLLTLCHRGTL